VSQLDSRTPCCQCSGAANAEGCCTRLVRERLPNLLDPWLQAVKESELPELCRFAAGIERDQSAVLAALSLAWSNGPVEAQVQKLKVVKRQMFGRAKFDLLRQRVLHRV